MMQKKIDAVPIREVKINEHALKNVQFHPTLINSSMEKTVAKRHRSESI